MGPTIHLLKDVNQDKITTFKARIKAIKGVELYDTVQTIELCLVSNVIVPKKFQVLKFIKYIENQCPISHMKSYCNKMTKIVHDEKILMHFSNIV